jgi:acetyltransferase-like isoleucine patch superfamily enzyme
VTSPTNIFFDLDELAALGPQTIVGRTVRIRKPGRCRIGDHSIIDDFSYISCGITVGRFTHIGAQAVLIGGDAHITIGDFVNIAPGCRLVASSHDFSAGGLCGPTIPPEFATPSVSADIRVDDHVLLGTGTVILPGVHLPTGVATGALTLITPATNLEPWTLYAGTPARPLKSRRADDILAAAHRLLEHIERG